MAELRHVSHANPLRLWAATPFLQDHFGGISMHITDTMRTRMHRLGSALQIIQDRTTWAEKPRTVPKQGASGNAYRIAFVIHKWSGLVGALWLGVLGLTGYFLDHDTWRWQWHSKVPSWMMPDRIVEQSNRSVTKLLQINPLNLKAQVSGGPRGVWYSIDGGATWQPTKFYDGNHLQNFAIEPDPVRGWAQLWFGTDDGIWTSEDGGATAIPFALQGTKITALSAGANEFHLIGVVDKTDVFDISTKDPTLVHGFNLIPPSEENRPLEFPLNRFLHELHFGRAVFDRDTSLLLNDVGGVGLFVLCLTGFLYWMLPKSWRSKSKDGRAKSAIAPATKKATILWLFRIHSVTIGIASFFMIFYLVVSGVLIGHGRELGDWMRSVKIPHAYLPPAFDLRSWDSSIDSIAAYQNEPGKFSIGNRFGFFTTVDGGLTWKPELDQNNRPVTAAASLRRIGGDLLAVNGMAAPSFIRGADSQHHEVKPKPRMMQHVEKDGAAMPPSNAGNNAMRQGAGGGMAGMYMPTDVTVLGDRFAWRNQDKIILTDASGVEVERLPFAQIKDDGVPWFTVFLRLHTGAIFWTEWKWVNDVFSVLAIVLIVTGLMRWWRKKWA